MMERLVLASVSGTAGLVVVALVCLLVRRLPANVRCWLWRLAVLKMALALVWVLEVPIPRVAPPVIEEPAAREIATVSSAPDAGQRPARPVQEETALPVSDLTQTDPWQVAWIAGMIMIGGGLLVRGELSRRNLRGSPPATSVAPVVDALAIKAGVRSPRVLRMEGAPIALHGVVRPAIVVPSEQGRLGAALAHELAHVKRRDPVWSALLTLAALPFWFLPPVWLALRAHRDAMEEATDALALDWGVAREDLAHSLVSYASRCPSPALALGGGGKRIAWRIRRLYDVPWSRGRSLIVIAGLALPLAMVLVPWRAIAADLDSPPNLNERSLDRASLVLLGMPSVREDLGYTDAQWEAKKPAYDAWKKRFSAFGDRANELQLKQASDDERLAFDAANRPRLFRELDEIKLSALRADQLKRLRQCGLQYYGALAMLREEVAKELGLTARQLAYIRQLRETYRKKVAGDVNAIFLPRGVPDAAHQFAALTPAERRRYWTLSKELRHLSGQRRREMIAKLWPLEIKMMNPPGRRRTAPSIAEMKRSSDEHNLRRSALRKSLTEMALRSLTEEQRQTWRKLIGKPSRFQLLAGVLMP